ncbi:YitT family protein [Thalassovita mediterranea]|jgi:uncharacterized membrane-anchored protein YitT (DUF2179 family)|uniref:BCR, YitT family n=1 Tax=Thalassovita mediterranea TaxID=340021 RepID=A0A0P1GLY1_9RHOB|nr:YitT family protein [Thalassovita mediterranea]MCG7574792.1 YitT family protein [Phaeobacter sp. CNT1-3]CUH83161.1 hypothetical protein TM5383_00344 [Thalassovita mediterranea]SIS33369.1 Uncharacterized membrane-anchored protein YitT, contains DUF161 and DUF2179 domains [Thalassovita mediterranea]
MADIPNQNPQKHTLLADVQGFLFGTTMASFSLVLLTHLGMVTGQTAGLAVLLSYVTGYGFGPIFFVVNLPFYWLAIKRMGWVFTAKTFAAIAVMSLMTELLPDYVSFDAVNPVVGAVLVGMLSGMALLALFRHGASLGGVGILALYLQDKTGFRAGYTQLLFDVCVFAAAFFVIDVPLVLYSLLGAVVLNLNIAVNHRKDWYIAS